MVIRAAELAAGAGFYVADDLVFTLGKHDVVPVPDDGGMTLYRTGDIKMDGILTVNNKVYFNDDVAFAGDIVATTGTKTANRSIFKYDENDQLVTGKINIGSNQTTVSMYQLDIGNPTTMASVTKEGVLTVQDFVINGDIYSDVDEPKYIFTQRPGTSITLGGATAYVHIPGTLKVGGGFGSGPLRIGQLSGNHSEMTIGNSSVFSVDFQMLSFPHFTRIRIYIIYIYIYLCIPERTNNCMQVYY